MPAVNNHILSEVKGTSGLEGRHRLYPKKDMKNTANVCGQMGSQIFVNHRKMNITGEKIHFWKQKSKETK